MKIGILKLYGLMILVLLSTSSLGSPTSTWEKQDLSQFKSENIIGFTPQGEIAIINASNPDTEIDLYNWDIEKVSSFKHSSIKETLDKFGQVRVLNKDLILLASSNGQPINGEYISINSRGETQKINVTRDLEDWGLEPETMKSHFLSSEIILEKYIVVTSNSFNNEYYYSVYEIATDKLIFKYSFSTPSYLIIEYLDEKGGFAVDFGESVINNISYVTFDTTAILATKKFDISYAKAQQELQFESLFISAIVTENNVLFIGEKNISSSQYAVELYDENLKLLDEVTLPGKVDSGLQTLYGLGSFRSKSSAYVGRNTNSEMNLDEISLGYEVDLTSKKILPYTFTKTPDIPDTGMEWNFDLQSLNGYLYFRNGSINWVYWIRTNPNVTVNAGFIDFPAIEIGIFAIITLNLKRKRNTLKNKL